MDVNATIETLLHVINRRGPLSAGVSAAMGGTIGNMQMLQRDINQAIVLWQESHDATGLMQMTATLHAYGNLSDDEYEQIMTTLNGEN